MIFEVLPRYVPREVANIDAGATTTAGTAQRAGTAGAALAILAHEDEAPLQLGVVQLGNGGRRVTGVLKRHEATALGACSARLKHHVGMQNVANRFEVIFEVLPRYVPREVADIDAGATTARGSHCARAFGGVRSGPAGNAGSGASSLALAAAAAAVLHHFVQGSVKVCRHIFLRR